MRGGVRQVKALDRRWPRPWRLAGPWGVPGSAGVVAAASGHHKSVLRPAGRHQSRNADYIHDLRPGHHLPVADVVKGVFELLAGDGYAAGRL